MADAAQEKLSAELQDGFKKFEKNCMRALQAKTFRCSAQCCEDKTSSSEVVHRCVAACNKKTTEIEHAVQDEMQRIQDRLTRCARQCEDEFKDHQSKLKEAESEAEKCLIRCCDTHSKLIPDIFSRLRAKTET